ncbi:DUF3500 domain-containing protein [Streptomyces paludis]|uniref:DUF3500 domain-containing protein n=1 Tax=Streptomyces paludis TaxID=2282738 RepID=A0A345HR06_9ACTN|nr:DUF3500 domain-containing protein [Streptomyces paludis]AXG79130.1 DUF3500 domain-containing protein [Streptomyces paludis]
MTELDTGDAGTAGATQDTAVRAETGRRAHASRRTFMRKVFLAGGATAVATMGGAGAWTALADDDTGTAAPDPSATDTATTDPSGAPGGGPGGPGGGAGGPGNEGITEEFFGVTTDGKRIDDLYTVHSQGVKTAPVIAAATAFLAGLSDTERSDAQFSLHSTEWRLWSNIDAYTRQGVSIENLSAEQNALGEALLTAALSAQGLETTQLTRRINKAACEAINQTQYAEAYYWTVMGTPSATEPWGFQFDGHHLVINYFVLGDQVVMSPCFWGCEPTSMEIDNKTVDVMQDEIKAALAAVNSLDTAQRSAAILKSTKDNEELIAGAFSDNAVQEYTGIRANRLTSVQRTKLLALIELFVGKAKNDVAKVQMSEVRKHLQDTHFAWMGGTAATSAFYCRVQSPVIWIEVDCQSPFAFGSLYGEQNGGAPTQQHLHCVVRTPNGNDYGKELLRQHLLTSPHHR